MEGESDITSEGVMEVEMYSKLLRLRQEMEKVRAVGLPTHARTMTLGKQKKNKNDNDGSEGCNGDGGVGDV